MQLNADETGSAHVSFVPIKPENYELYVGNVPSALKDQQEAVHKRMENL